MYLHSFSHFRGIAILFVVASHCYGFAGLKLDSLFENSIGNIITGATGFFVFISGFMFHHVFYKTFNYKIFLTKKAHNILLPYVILGSIPIALAIIDNTSRYGGFFTATGTGLLNESLIPAIKYYSTGRFLTAYWFIPFILICFLLAPLHVKFVSLSNKHQWLTIILLSLVSVIIHRPLHSISPIHSLLYFTPIYLFGISSSLQYQKILLIMKGKEYWLLALAYSLALLQASLGHKGNYYKAAFEWGGIDLMYFQKIVLCIFFMVWLNRFEHKRNAYLNTLASSSFAIFFIHPFILKFTPTAIIDNLRHDSWLNYGLIATGVTLIALLTAKLIQKLLPNHSRFIIGA